MSLIAFLASIFLMACLISNGDGFIYKNCRITFPTRLLSTETASVAVGGISKLTRYDVIPITLYRAQSSESVSLRSYERKVEEGKTGNFSFDLHEKPDGLVYPVEGDTFEIPNGMSCRPIGSTHLELIMSYKGNLKIFVLEAGMKVPDKLVLIHEHSDHYSMQPRVPMSLDTLNGELTKMLKSCTTISKEEYLKLYEAEDDEDEFNN